MRFPTPEKNDGWRERFIKEFCCNCIASPAPHIDDNKHGPAEPFIAFISQVEQEAEERGRHNACKLNTEQFKELADEYREEGRTDTLKQLEERVEREMADPKLHSKGSVGDIHNRALNTILTIIREMKKV